MTSGRFAGKTVVVTGGNSGLGLDAAKAFAREAASVIITGRNQQSLDTAAQMIGAPARAVRCDVSRVDEIAALAVEISGREKNIDILYVNAGIGTNARFADVTEKLWDQTFDINAKGLFFTVQKLAPLMQDGGSIVINLSAAHRLAVPGGAAYGASKAAGRSLTRSLANELIERGIRVNSVSPGPIEETAIVQRSNLPPEAQQVAMKMMGDATPMKRTGRPSEVTSAVLFLASDDASYITGEDITISGGQGLLF